MAGGPLVFKQGQPIMLDPAGALYAAIGAASLRSFTDGTDTVSHFGISN